MKSWGKQVILESELKNVENNVSTNEDLKFFKTHQN